MQGNAAYVFKPNLAIVTNALLGCANLQISKTDNRSTVAVGDTLVYNITVTNNGPAAADGAVLSDPVGTGIGCATPVSCSNTGSAVCPTAPIALSALQTGIAIPALPANSSVTVALICTAN